MSMGNEVKDVTSRVWIQTDNPLIYLPNVSLLGHVRATLIRKLCAFDLLTAEQMKLVSEYSTKK